MLDRSNSLIIGYGIVGKTTANALGIKEYLDDYPADDDYSAFIGKKYIVMCLPTPTLENGKQDTSIINNWMQKISNYVGGDPVIILRSTVLPGTTRYLEKEYGLEVVHVPEFLTESSAVSDTLRPEIVVVGADNLLLREKVAEIFEPFITFPDRLIKCDSVTAEMIKYSLNTFFALKVIYGNQIWDVCKKAGADYGLIKKALETHKWGSKNGWDVWHKGFRGYGGSCLPKDTKAIATEYELPLIKEMIRINKKLVEETK